MKRQPDNLSQMMELADIISKSSVKSFSYGLAYQLNDYTADGTIFDYMAGHRKVGINCSIYPETVNICSEPQ